MPCMGRVIPAALISLHELVVVHSYNVETILLTVVKIIKVRQHFMLCYEGTFS